MKPLIYLTSLFYHYYNSGNTKDIAYGSAIMGVVGFMWLNCVSIIGFLGLWNSFSLGFENLNNYKLWGCMALIGVLGSGLLALLVPKKKILAIDFEKRDKGTDYFILFTYAIVSFILFVVSAKLPR